MKGVTVGLACVALAATIIGCPAKIHVRLRGGENLNPNKDGKARPVRAKVYQLRDPSSFERATFDAVWLEEAKTLGPDLLDKSIGKEIQETKAGRERQDTVVIFEEDKGLKKETQFIGVAVAFEPPNLNPDMQGKWKKAVPLADVNATLFFMDYYELFLKEK